MEYNLGSNQASNFKSAERVAQGRFDVTDTVIPITKCEEFSRTSFAWKSHCNMFNRLYETVEKQQKRTQLSVHEWRANGVGVQLQVSNLKLFKLDTCNWIPTWSRTDYATNRRAQNQSKSNCYRYDFINICSLCMYQGGGRKPAVFFDDIAVPGNEANHTSIMSLLRMTSTKTFFS